MDRAFVEKSLHMASRPTVQTEQLLHFILDHALPICPSTAAAIFLFDKPFLETVGSESSWLSTPPKYACMETSLEGAAVAITSPPRRYGLREYPTFPERFPLCTDSRSMIFVPLREVNRILGWLALECPEEDRDGAQHAPLLHDLACASVPAVSRCLLRDRMASAGYPLDVVGVSPELLDLERQTRFAANCAQGPVLITGERGSGKELIAEAIHFMSDRRHRNFVPVLSSAFSQGLFADELFGHERSSFTGATHERQGKFKAAEGGTVFLDEVGDLDLEVQASLLRILERGELPRIGRDMPLRVDVRVVAATNRDLPTLMEKELFRRDLYDRLSVFEVAVPPLRVRRADIVPLANHFLRAHCNAIGRNSCCGGGCDHADYLPCATGEFYAALKTYDWPGNVRELANLMLRMMATHPDEVLDARHLPSRVRENRRGATEGVEAPSSSPTVEVMKLSGVIERHLRYAVGVAKGNKTEAARLLGLPRSTLTAMLRRYGVSIV
jgi:two-component system, NtrC family, response regulator HydG